MFDPGLSLKCPLAQSELDGLPRRTLPRGTPNARIRAHGAWVRLNLEDWRPGDIVLFASTGNTKSKVQDAAVALFQRRKMSEQTAKWVHVGLYDGAGAIWELMPGANVRRRKIKDIIGTNRILHVRRMKGLKTTRAKLYNDGVKPHQETHYDLVPVIAEHLGIPTSENPQVAACSVFVDRVLWQLTKKRLFPNVVHPMPSHFAASDAFDCVAIRWYRA